MHIKVIVASLNKQLTIIFIIDYILVYKKSENACQFPNAQDLMPDSTMMMIIKMGVGKLFDYLLQL